MTTPPLDLDAIRGRHETYAAIHSTSGAFAQCAAQESAEDVPALIDEVARLRAALADIEARIATVVALPTATRAELEQMDREGYHQAIGYSGALWKVKHALTSADYDDCRTTTRHLPPCPTCHRAICPGCTAPTTALEGR